MTWPYPMEFWIVALALLFATFACTVWFKFMSRSPESAAILARGDKARIVTIMAIVVGAGCLAVLKVITGEQITTLFAAIAGFVLGDRHKSQSESAPTASGVTTDETDAAPPPQGEQED